MKVRHTVHVVGRCPADDAHDYYRVDVYSDTFLRCEVVLTACDALVQEPVFQEDLTQRLADQLGCKVRTRGKHCRGAVDMTCVAWPQMQGKEAME